MYLRHVLAAIPAEPTSGPVVAGRLLDQRIQESHGQNGLHTAIHQFEKAMEKLRQH